MCGLVLAETKDGEEQFKVLTAEELFEKGLRTAALRFSKPKRYGRRTRLTKIGR